MIRFVKRNQLDEDKYNSCVSTSMQSRVYAYSWYLDIVVDNWDVLVLNDYEAVMPLPWKRKYFIKYMYPPFWILELGVFSQKENMPIENFIAKINTRFQFIESRLNTLNKSKHKKVKAIERRLQFLHLDADYQMIYKAYKKDKKKDLKKAAEAKLRVQWHDYPENLIELFKNNVGKRISKIDEIEYHKLLQVIRVCIKNGVGEVLSIYNSENALVASGFFLKHKGRITLLVSSTDFNNRNNGANTFLIDRAIFKFYKEFKTFHFGGSSIEAIARYFKSFGAKTETYFLLKKRLL